MGIFSKIFTGAPDKESEEPKCASPGGEARDANAHHVDAELAEGTIDEPPPIEKTPSQPAHSIRAHHLAPPRVGQKPRAAGVSPVSQQPQIRPENALRSLTQARPPASPPDHKSPPPQATAETVTTKSSDESSESRSKRSKRSTGQQIESAFDSLENGDCANQRLGASAQQAAREAAMETFRGVASWYVSHVRNLMLEVKWGTPASSWLQGCERSIRSLSRFAREVEWKELAERLSDFSRALAKSRSRGPRVTGELKEALMSAYQPLVGLLPDAFALGEEKERREPVIVRSLLLQVPGVETVEVERLHAAGLTTLEALFAAGPDEIAATSGLPEKLASNIVEHVHTYKSKSTSALACDPETSLSELRELAGSLEGIQIRFEEAAAGWSRDLQRQKRALRREREQTMLGVNIALARLGALERLAHLEELPFEERIEELNAYLRDAERQQRALGRA